jgi:hypothetical protein
MDIYKSGHLFPGINLEVTANDALGTISARAQVIKELDGTDNV